MIREEKQLLREQMKEALRAFPQKDIASQAIRGLLYSSEAWQSAKVIYGYVPMPTEPDWLGSDWPEGKTLAFPKTTADGDMQFYCSKEFRIGPWKAHEPVGEELAPPPDLVLVPGIAFDRDGFRMGRGGGFYDRWLERHPGAKKVGLCFRCQVVERVPREPHDARMDGVMTEEGIMPGPSPS